MKKRFNFFASISLLLISAFLLLQVDKSYSYSLDIEITGSGSKHKLIYKDAYTGAIIDAETVIKYYNESSYTSFYEGKKELYFYKGNEIGKAEYLKGSSVEKADQRAKLYGNAAIRVHSTNEFKRAFDTIYQNYKIGNFYIEFSPYENIDLEEVNQYYNKTYGLEDYKQNYYTYARKGEFEPFRFGIQILESKTTGELFVESYNIRISGNEKKVVEDFIQKLLPYMQGDGSDYEKILAAYTYITERTSYLVDDGFVMDFLASNTSIYDVFINRKSVCIGYSIAFSYLMDKMGIESYIVDQATKIDPINKIFNSVHTYNIVKLENKFYKIDLTGKIFLSGISQNTLSSSILPISNTAYNTTGKKKKYNFDYNKINSLLNTSKKIKTTTTRKIDTTTTKETTLIPPIKTTSKKQYTTQKTKETNTHSSENIHTEESVTTIKETTAISGMTSSKITKEIEAIEKKKEFNWNYILLGLVAFVMILLVLYEYLKKREKSITHQNKEL